MKEILLKILRERKISLQKISDLSGVHINSINHWLRDGIEPTLTNAEKVLKALGYKIIVKEDKDVRKFDS